MAAVLVLLVLDVTGVLNADWFLDAYLWSVFAIGAVLCAVRAVQVPAERFAWSLFAAGWCFYVAGGIVFQTILDESSAHFPSLADVLWLGMYVCCLAGLVALMRARGIVRKAAWLDGAGLPPSVRPGPAAVERIVLRAAAGTVTIDAGTFG